MTPRAATATSLQPERYDQMAIAAHWLLAVLILLNLALGLYMHDLPLSPQRLKLFNWHKWAGITILALSALRLVWRLGHPPPPDLPMPAWQRSAAHAVHWAMYGLFFAVPLAGWGYSSAAGFPVVWFGVLPLPDWAPVDRGWAEALKGTHKAAALTLALLVLLHVAAALKHHVVDRDGLLHRMRPFWR
jgi:cytochrome b561